jgi:hypothetical protein
MHSIAKDTDCVNIPGPEEPRWVVLVCFPEPVYDPETGEDTGTLEFFLYRTVAPRTSGHVDAEDPSTWADWATAQRCRWWVSDFIEGGLPRWGVPGSTAYTGFVADGELYLAITARPPVPISHDRSARVRP